MHNDNYGKYRREVAVLKRKTKVFLNDHTRKNPGATGIVTVSAVGELFAEIGVFFLGKKATLMMLDEIAQIVMIVDENEPGNAST